MMNQTAAYLVVALQGVVVAGVGAIGHRSIPPWGVVLCVVMVIAAAVFSRTWRGFAGLAVFAAAWSLVSFVLSREGPGGSVLIADGTLGYAWLISSAVAIFIAAVIPASLLQGRNVTA
jgi:hypothetical protein